jgi:hypothetical protein
MLLILEAQEYSNVGICSNIYFLTLCFQTFSSSTKFYFAILFEFKAISLCVLLNLIALVATVVQNSLDHPKVEGSS